MTPHASRLRSRHSAFTLIELLVVVVIMGILVALPIFITSDKDWWPTFGGFGWLGPILIVAIIIWFLTTLRTDDIQPLEN